MGCQLFSFVPFTACSNSFCLGQRVRLSCPRVQWPTWVIRKLNLAYAWPYALLDPFPPFKLVRFMTLYPIGRDSAAPLALQRETFLIHRGVFQNRLDSSQCSWWSLSKHGGTTCLSLLVGVVRRFRSLCLMRRWKVSSKNSEAVGVGPVIVKCQTCTGEERRCETTPGLNAVNESAVKCTVAALRSKVAFQHDPYTIHVWNICLPWHILV